MHAPADLPARGLRRGFASAADVTAFAETLGRFERGEITADEWRAFRLVNGSYPQRQEGDAQMLRVKAPQGAPRRGAARGARRGGRALVARLRPRHDPPEPAAPLREAPRPGEDDRPPRRGGPDDARGLRQLGPQRHRLPLRRRRTRRGVRRHAVRGGVHAALPAPPAEREPAAQVQGGLRGVPGGPRFRGDQRHRLAGARARHRERAARARLSRDGRRGHGAAVHFRRRPRRLPPGHATC